MEKGEEDSENSVEEVQSSTAAEIEIGENENQSAGSAASEKSEDEREAKAPPGEAKKKGAKAEAVAETKKEECVIEVKRDGRSSGAEGGSRAKKVCRICHFGFEISSENSELIRSGCGCKEELGVSHLHYVEACFMHKGKSQTEIAHAVFSLFFPIEIEKLKLKFPDLHLLEKLKNCP
ncbi:hypothetical protein U1Q18_020311 [Sarracenia purpurea var. burkii]